jgi:hypothetical protein
MRQSFPKAEAEQQHSDLPKSIVRWRKIGGCGPEGFILLLPASHKQHP